MANGKARGRGQVQGGSPQQSLTDSPGTQNFRIFRGMSPALMASPQYAVTMMAPLVIDPAITHAVQQLGSDRATSGWLRLSVLCNAIDADSLHLCFGLPQPGQMLMSIPFSPAVPTMHLDGRSFREGEVLQLAAKFFGIHDALLVSIKTNEFMPIITGYQSLLSSTFAPKDDTRGRPPEDLIAGIFRPPDESAQHTATLIALEWVSENRTALEKYGSPTRCVPFFGQQEFTIRDNFIFVLMPFTAEHEGIFEGVIKPLAKRKQLVCRKADDAASRVIMEDIWRQINEARVIVADLTGSNANVLYELGIAHTLGKPVILIRQKGENHEAVPFDVQHVRMFLYENSIPGGKRLSEDLESALDLALKE